MLRASALTNKTDIDIQCVNGDAQSADKNIPFGPLLLAFAEAIANRNASGITQTREALELAAGSQVVVEAAAVAANFQRMVRIADSIGIPVDNMTTELGQGVRSELGLEKFASAQNTLASG